MQPRQQQNIHLDDAERQPCEVWTRVMGYHRPVAAFNPGKQQEQRERKHFIETTPIVDCHKQEE